ncbi:biliverdin-producing heme oxygenase [Fulvivirga sediminis]|uniref:Biliverdin-producing heme oxygenase n=1 Tax=Fulvivirga sediminis TaxID=2803949 RepID=A0A937FCF7_9BACT|nr:biliverdin-producing heme oxygenase [Fulvivirga sediminis]MBL3658350.1 biliverdin-producing heme oxygenase [Fulvivirga sediminis]
MIAELLKNETAELHKLSEKNNYFREIYNSTLTLQQYETMLIRNYWLNLNVEQAAQNISEVESLSTLELAKRKKAHLIVKDLNNLDSPSIDLPEESFPELNSAEIMGALYVTEGSTLGGNIILKNLMKNKAFDGKNIFNFLSYYGENTSSYWKVFLETLILYHSKNRDKEDDIINGAKKAFEYFITLSHQLN